MCEIYTHVLEKYIGKKKFNKKVEALIGFTLPEYIYAYRCFKEKKCNITSRLRS